MGDAHKELWQLEAEKLGGAALADALTDMRDTQNSMVVQLGSIETKTTVMLNAFPGGDTDSHRRFHESLIRKAEERTKFWAELRVKLAEKGIWAVVMFLCAALYWYVKEGPKQ